MKTAGVLAAGLAASLLVAAAWWAGAGLPAARGALVAGLLATGAQGAAHAWLAGVAPDAPASAMWRRHLHGTALRAGAAGLVIALVVHDRVTYPPLATVTSCAGLILFLLSIEIRNRT